MILLLSSLVYATVVAIFPLRFLPKNIKQSPQQREIQEYIQGTLIHLSSGKDLDVVTEDMLIKRIEGTQYYDDLLKNCKKSDCIKSIAVVGQVPFIIATRFYSYKSIHSMTMYLYEIEHPSFSHEMANVDSKEISKKQNKDDRDISKHTNDQQNTQGNVQQSSPKKENRRSKRRNRRKEKKQEQVDSLVRDPFSTVGVVQLIDQQSCSAGEKEDLLGNCKHSIMELLDGQLGLVNLLHPFTVQGPEPMRSCLQQKLPDVPYARTIELREKYKPAEAAAFRATATGSIQMLVDGISFVEMEWSSDAETIQQAMQNVKNMEHLHEGVTRENVCQQLANRLTKTGYRDAGE